MNVKNSFIIFLFIFASVSCSHKTWVVTHATSTKIALDSSTEAIADKNYESYLQPLKERVGAKMNVVIGQAAETMKGHGPESLLSNFSADVYKRTATVFLGEKVDIGIVNLGGLRTVVPAGNITVGKVFELMPFENELVILWLKGDKLDELLQYFASMGGEGVSGLRMVIDHGKATNITIDGKPLDKDKLYTIATNDYLAGGNDKMIQLAQHVKRVNTGIKVRDMLLDYIKNETRKGNKIQSKLDGRITISK
ncbi:MAG: 5'-nucleotidase C-terminal domain-containing protein [Paludibacter sp.]|nr:5'-nucleotidase C-terminal domain-containing protein [Paludibacter sp.]